MSPCDDTFTKQAPDIELEVNCQQLRQSVGRCGGNGGCCLAKHDTYIAFVGRRAGSRQMHAKRDKLKDS